MRKRKNFWNGVMRNAESGEAQSYPKALELSFALRKLAEKYHPRDASMALMVVLAESIVFHYEGEGGDKRMVEVFDATLTNIRKMQQEENAKQKGN